MGPQTSYPVSGSPYLRIAVADAVGWLVFDKPARHNAASFDMWQALPGAVAALDEDPAVRVIVLVGAGRAAFMSGGDIAEFGRLRATLDQVTAYDDQVDAAFAALGRARRPTVAAIRGYCLGGGMGLAAACDIRLADDTAIFGIPAARLGVGYRAGGLKRLVDLIGPGWTKEIFFTGRCYDAATALRIGFLQHVWPAADFECFVADYCATVSANAPLTVASVKAVVEHIGNGQHAMDAAWCQAQVDACFAAEDHAEGRRAFLEKRTPVFRGR